MKTKNTAFTIRVDQDEWLEEQAKLKILNKSILVREAIDLLINHEKLYHLETKPIPDITITNQGE